MQSGYTIVHNVELVYNLQHLPSISFTNGWGCTRRPGRGCRDILYKSSQRNPVQFGELVSGVEGLGVRGGLVWTRQPVIGFEAEQISWDWICGRGWWENRESRGVHRRSIHRSLPSPVAPGLVILKGGRLKGLMEAGVMLCGVI